MNPIEHPIFYEDLETTRFYTATAPSSHEWYHATQNPIGLDRNASLDIQRACLDAYRCEWDLSYKTLDAKEANRTPYSYKVLTQAAKDRILSSS